MTDTDDYGLIYRLSEHNADRPCETCRKRADYYLFTSGVISTFRCSTHLPDDVYLLEGER